MTSLRPLSFLFALSLLAVGARAQESTAAPAKQATAATPAGSESSSTTAVTSSAAAEAQFDSRETREEFRQLLERHPREVGIVLKLDPSLFRNEVYLSSYPALAAFVRQHPEVAQNPGYFLDSVWIPGDEAPEPAAVRASRETLQGVTVLVGMLIFTVALTWLIRTLLEHRRWSRVSRIQTELHNKLLDRFTSHEDLLRYVQSAAGKQFLDLASSPLPATAQSVSAPLGRILWSVQAGVVLVVVGLGMQFVSGRSHPDVAPTILTLGVIALCVGLGFIGSSFVGYKLSQKLGLLPPAAATTVELEVPPRD